MNNKLVIPENKRDYICCSNNQLTELTLNDKLERLYCMDVDVKNINNDKLVIRFYES